MVHSTSSVRALRTVGMSLRPKAAQASLTIYKFCWSDIKFSFAKFWDLVIPRMGSIKSAETYQKNAKRVNAGCGNGQRNSAGSQTPAVKALIRVKPIFS